MTTFDDNNLDKKQFIGLPHQACSQKWNEYVHTTYHWNVPSQIIFPHCDLLDDGKLFDT